MKITLVLQNNNKYNETHDDYQRELFTTFIDVMQNHVDKLKNENMEFQNSLFDLREKIEIGEIDINSPEFLTVKDELNRKLYNNISSVPSQKEIMSQVYAWMENMRVIDEYADNQSDDYANYEFDDYDLDS